MAESNETPEDKVLSADDPLDINELASLNEEISDDFIEQLQNQISASSNVKNDGDLFEETADANSDKPEISNDDSGDSFMKKYMAKKDKGSAVEEIAAPNPAETEPEQTEDVQNTIEAEETIPNTAELEPQNAEDVSTVSAEKISDRNISEAETVETAPQPEETKNDENSIESVTGGNITERPLSKENTAYNESLDYVDGNVKYSKYVVYIDPENKDFIDSLTVKERKNLINRIIREQDSISVTKRRLSKMQAILMHTIVAILTITIAIPCIYWTINASLEATINNYRASQSVFSQLYRQHGKIKTNTQR